jgi:phenylacetate-coenzyme A ligase PaaK-like adenylate-forming protein
MMPLAARIFGAHQDFDQLALEIFHYQAEKNFIYKSYLHALAIDARSCTSVNDIPFLPVSFFKTHKVTSVDKTEIVFESSATGGQASKHYVADVEVYHESFMRGFEIFYGDPQQYCILALLPSYLERTGSSLVYMCEKLILQSGHPLSGFYLNNLDELRSHLKALKQQKVKVMLFGVTYALLDLVKDFSMDYPDLIIVETGGMKGRRREMIREEMHSLLQAAFNVPAIHSEYGMTELLSQAWSSGKGLFHAPPWMKIRTRDINDPLAAAGDGVTGAVNIIDLANVHSCSFIATDDLGKTYPDGSFEILGRFDYSDVRGCNLMIS